MDIHPGTKVPGDVRSSIEIANDLGQQVVDIRSRPRGTRARAAVGGQRAGVAGPGSGQRRAGRAFGRPTTSGRPGREPEPVDRRPRHVAAGSGHGPAHHARVGRRRRLWQASAVRRQPPHPADAPTALDTVTAVATTAATGPGGHIGAASGVRAAEDRARRFFQSGIDSGGPGGSLVTSQFANLGCIFHDSAGVLSDLAQSTEPHQPVPDQAEDQSFYGRRRPGGDTRISPTRPPAARAGNPGAELFSCEPAGDPANHLPPPRPTPRPTRFPMCYPGPGCRRLGGGDEVGPATQAGFVPAAGGGVVAPTSQEAEIGLNGQPPSSGATYVTPASICGAPGRGRGSGAGAPAGVGGPPGPPPGPTPMIRHRSRS